MVEFKVVALVLRLNKFLQQRTQYFNKVIAKDWISHNLDRAGLNWEDLG
jgi:hypothetical protein